MLLLGEIGLLNSKKMRGLRKGPFFFGAKGEIAVDGIGDLVTGVGLLVTDRSTVSETDDCFLSAKEWRLEEKYLR